jgi:hypothetical protein
MARAVLIDGRNQFDATEARRAGFDYTGIGYGLRSLAETGSHRL